MANAPHMLSWVVKTTTLCTNCMLKIENNYNSNCGKYAKVSTVKKS